MRLTAAQSTKVTKVLFGDTPGTNITPGNDGTFTVTTPAHTAGTLDVTIEWTLFGAPQTPIVYRDGYIFTATPTITHPADTTKIAGTDAIFTVTTTGIPTPTVTWESSTNGTTWTAVQANQVSSDGNTLTVPNVNVALTGTKYRATAINSAGTTTSDPATLTVNPAPAIPTVTLNLDGNSVVAGETATFTATAEGTPAPTLVWEESIDHGTTWQQIGSGNTPAGSDNGNGNEKDPGTGNLPDTGAPATPLTAAAALLALIGAALLIIRTRKRAALTGDNTK